MRYILIDRIERLERGKAIRAIKCVSLAEDVYTDHFVGAPVMPGALLIESLAQAGTALLEVSGQLTQKALLIMVDRAKVRGIVRPGDRLVIEAEVVSQDANSARLNGAISVDGRAVMTATVSFALAPVDDYYVPRWRNAVYSTYEIWLRDAELIGVSVPREDD
jgi:3-hydroxyacyl-[acyl-carrier-protein] dehydratase